MEWELSLPELAVLANSALENGKWMMAQPQGCNECIRDAFALHRFALDEFTRRIGPRRES